MKLPRQALFGQARRPVPDSTDGGREMNTLHSTTASAVSRVCTPSDRGAEKSGATGGPVPAGGARGCARGTGRQHGLHDGG